MLNNNFVWTDLTTFNLGRAKTFYSQVFDWYYQSSDTIYHTAYTNNKEASGLYLMPEKFQKFNLPSFWMSYIKVADIDSAIIIASQQEGKVEMVDKENPIGKIALIRDPLGSGFTIYEGDYLNGRLSGRESSYLKSELVVSDISKVKSFYKNLFDWTIQEVSKTHHKIYNGLSKHIAEIIEVPNSIKGKDEYWGVYFYSSALNHTKHKIVENGGSIVHEEKNYILCKDPFGAAFNITHQL